jgi:hypothetical protein
VLYAEEEVSVYAEVDAVDDEKKKDKRKKNKSKESRRSTSKRHSRRSASKDRRHGKIGHTSENKGERRHPYERWNQEEVKNPERRRQVTERYTAKSMVSDFPSPPADMVWREDRKSSQQSHSHAIAKTDSSTFLRAELAVVPPAPVTAAIYPVEFGAHGKEEALCDKERKDKRHKKKNKETQRTSSKRQSPRWDDKERHNGKDGNTLDTMGERAEHHGRRKQEEKNPELRCERQDRGESKKSSTSHRRSVRNSQAGEENHLDGHTLRTPPVEQPERVTKPTEVDCDRLLMQLLHAQREMLKEVTGENNDAPPASHPLILTWDQDFQDAFHAFTRDTTESFEKSFGEISHQYFLSKDPRHESFHETPSTPTVQRGVLDGDALDKNAENERVPTGDDFFELSRAPFHH